MVNYKDGEIAQIIPYNLLDPEVRAVSYAIGKEKRQFIKYAAATSLYASIHDVPETVLDLMALELNTQYYEQNLPRKAKEHLVSQTLVWYMHAGTSSVLGEFLRTVLEGGYTEEWYLYGGEPYFFKAYVYTTEDDIIQQGFGTEIKRRIAIYKNARSWLESLAFILQTCFEVNVSYTSRLELISEFYARNNRSYLLLDGTWFLDGTYFLSGYRAGYVDFYPARLMIQGTVRMQVVLGSNGIWVTGTAAEASPEMDTLLCLCSGLQAQQRIAQELCVTSAVEAMPSVGLYLRVENNLWYLDGTYLLDGTKLLDAEIIEYDL